MYSRGAAVLEVEDPPQHEGGGGAEGGDADVVAAGGRKARGEQGLAADREVGPQPGCVLREEVDGDDGEADGAGAEDDDRLRLAAVHRRQEAGQAGEDQQYPLVVVRLAPAGDLSLMPAPDRGKDFDLAFGRRDREPTVSATRPVAF